jgi:precorrin-6Y C5,15-methyltransferase (decarboxylating)
VIAVLGVAGGRVAPDAEALLAGASLVVGGRETLALAPAGAETVPLGADLDAALARVGEGACVLASGDPGFFGIVRRLAEHFGREALDVRPAPSSVAVAFARLGIPWDDALVVSAHGRAPHVARHVAMRHPKVAILTSPDVPPEHFDLPGREVWVAERLGMPDERVVPLAERPFADPNVVLVLGAATAERATVWPPRTPLGWALPDDAFAHRAGMVTKREVRAVALSRLGPGTGDLVWDVGCHSASVAIECARLGAAAIAIDRDADAVVYARANADAHGVPVEVVEGTAPEALADLPDPDAVFVGGGGVDLGAILCEVVPRTRRAVVVTLALIDRAAPVLAQLEALGLSVDATMVQASRLEPLAGGHRLAAENPVIVVSGARA